MVAVDALKTSPLFSELDERELRLITPLCREKHYSKGETIFAKGDEANVVYVLQEGKVRLGYEICPQPDTCQDATIPVDQPGEVIGWSALVKPRRLTASAYCMTDVRLITIDGDALEQLMEQNSHVGFVVMKALAGVIAERLRQAKELTLGRLMGAL